MRRAEKEGKNKGKKEEAEKIRVEGEERPTQRKGHPIVREGRSLVISV